MALDRNFTPQKTLNLLKKLRRSIRKVVVLEVLSEDFKKMV